MCGEKQILSGRRPIAARERKDRKEVPYLLRSVRSFAAITCFDPLQPTVFRIIPLPMIPLTVY
jgi:hypothetical protein